mmetsp:Transcript_27094/g.55164  ORF Transcript_27094/g.55164 Transcript_27094/m.55164 type:complete len:515 (+) Transcript_27094:87-1631(+)
MSGILSLIGMEFVGEDEQLFLEHMTKTEVINGPQMVWLPPFRKNADKRKAISLCPIEYCTVKNTLTGEERTEQGPQLLFLKAYDEPSEIKNAISLKRNEFVRFLDKRTGKVRVEVGEQGQVLPSAYETCMDMPPVRKAIDLKCNEYVKIEDKSTGNIRVERGEQLIFLGGFEEIVGKKEKAIDIDSEKAVLVRNRRTGQQSLVTEKQTFFPSSDEIILEVRDLVKLAEYEGCIIRGKDGDDSFLFGSNPDQRCFFLPPHSEMVELLWSSGARRDRRDLRVSKIDLRPMYMWFEFNCRTADNVELVLEGSFFWQIVDVKAMVHFTADTSGDVCNHARSKFIERVSKVTLQQFMSDINKIAEEVHKEDDTFYTQRGVLIHSLEVTGYCCAEASTARILEQIIQETTNRMNRLQQQESENDVHLHQIKGDIEEEKAKEELLQVQIANSNTRSKMEGLAEAVCVKSFLASLADDIPDTETRVQLWNVLRKKDALDAVAGGGAQLFYTPSDVDLSIKCE